MFTTINGFFDILQLTKNGQEQGPQNALSGPLWGHDRNLGGNEKQRGGGGCEFSLDFM